MNTDNSTRRVLFVDDERNLLDAIRRQLRGEYDVQTALSGEEGLGILGQPNPFQVVVSDMRMPEMNGAAFLKQVRQVSPDTVRVLLTGQADVNAAILAVNEGQLFRFLCKPCPKEVLVQALESALNQYRLITAERVLLEKTLHGSVKALSDLLAIANPHAFGRANRIQRYARQMIVQMGLRERWPIEVAAMLSEIGAITLPNATAERLYLGVELSEAEQVMVSKVPEVTGRLLAHIPRLDPVMEILRHKDRSYQADQGTPSSLAGPNLPLGSRILKLVGDFDVLLNRGRDARAALSELHERIGRYDPELVTVLNAVCSESSAVHELPLASVKEGMTLAEDVRTHSGMLLVGRGQEVTHGLLERIRNFSKSGALRGPFRVLVPRALDERQVPSQAAGSVSVP